MKYPYSLVLAQPGNKLHTLADLTVYDCQPKMQAFMRINSLGDLWRDFTPWIGNALTGFIRANKPENTKPKRVRQPLRPLLGLNVLLISGSYVADNP